MWSFFFIIFVTLLTKRLTIKSTKMKKLFILLASVALLSSCNGNKGDSGNTKSDAADPTQQLNTTMVRFDKEVSDYIDGLNTKSVQDCQPMHIVLCNTYDSLRNMITDNYTNHKIEKPVYDTMMAKATRLFDKKAYAVKAKMAAGDPGVKQ